MTWQDAKDSWYFFSFLSFFFYFCESLHILCTGTSKSGHDFVDFWKIIIPLPIKPRKRYLPTPFCKFFSHKWNIPSLIASFRERLDGTFAEKFIFHTNHTWESRECQMILKKWKKKHQPLLQPMLLQITFLITKEISIYLLLLFLISIHLSVPDDKKILLYLPHYWIWHHSIL